MSVAYGEQQRHSAFGDTRFGAPAPSAAPSQRDLERQYNVVLQDSLGHPALGFRDGMWFRLTVSGPQALQLRGAIRHCPHAAGSIVQISCWWMRENPLQPRSLDLATELALTVGELVRVCPSDGLGSSASDLLAMPAAAAAPAAIPAVQALPAAPAPSVAPLTPPQSAFPSQMQAPVPTGSWFDPADTTGTGGFPAIPPAPVMGQSRAAAPAPAPNPVPGYQQARAPYPPAPQGYGGAAQPQAALPAATSYQPAPAPAAPPRPAAPRGYGEQNSDWDRPAASTGRRGVPQQPAPPQHQPRPAAPRLNGANGVGMNGTGVNGNGANGSGPQPRPRPQQPRPDFREERRDTFEGPRGADPGRSSDRLDRSGDRLDPRGANGVPPRRPAPRQPQQRGTMGQRPATRPGRPSSSDW